VIEIIHVLGDRREAIRDACVEIEDTKFDDLHQAIDLVHCHG